MKGSRISGRFAELRGNGTPGFVPFITAGDPDLETTLEILKILAKYDPVAIELGVPFSDPMADGPIIQASSERALDSCNPGIRDILEIVADFRRHSEIPIILFGYFNPINAYGVKEFVDDASTAGVDGVLVTDLIDEEFDEFSAVCRGHAIDLIALVAPTTTDTRLQRIVSEAGGFVYAISMTGVTGSDNLEQSSARDLVGRIRRYTNLPIAVGFGIKTNEDVHRVLDYADAAVVGSALVNQISKGVDKATTLSLVDEFVAELIAAPSTNVANELQASG